MSSVWVLSCRIIRLFLTFYFGINSVVMSERSLHATDRNEYCEEAAVACASDPASTVVTSLAVVPYDDLKISDFHRSERIFTFGNKRVVIGQNWRDVGIAAVVWDAVIILLNFLLFQTMNVYLSVLLGAFTCLCISTAEIFKACSHLADFMNLYFSACLGQPSRPLGLWI
jgi:hypothetical protein